MTDAQTLTTAILGAAGIIGGAVKWASRQLTKTQDRGIAALVRSAESNANLAAKFDAMTARFETRFEVLTARFDHFVEVLLTNGVGLTSVARMGRATTAPIVPTLTVLPVLSEDNEDEDD